MRVHKIAHKYTFNALPLNHTPLQKSTDSSNSHKFREFAQFEGRFFVRVVKKHLRFVHILFTCRHLFIGTVSIN